jgi:hypothetical protein
MADPAIIVRKAETISHAAASTLKSTDAVSEPLVSRGVNFQKESHHGGTERRPGEKHLENHDVFTRAGEILVE